jgi:hypothetical protein
MTVKIHGKDYKTVAERISEFRCNSAWNLYAISTEIIEINENHCIVKATISDNNGNKISDGHALEFRDGSFINKTSYLENCETSAIGRALAFFGLSGDEIASADEVANAIKSKPTTTQLTSRRNKFAEYFKKESKEWGVDFISFSANYLGIEVEKVTAQSFDDKQAIDFANKWNEEKEK